MKNEKDALKWALDKLARYAAKEKRFPAKQLSKAEFILHHSKNETITVNGGHDDFTNIMALWNMAKRKLDVGKAASIGLIKEMSNRKRNVYRYRSPIMDGSRKIAEIVIEFHIKKNYK